MTPEVPFVQLINLPNGFEADLARQTLEDAGIPVLLKGPQVGIFGAGFQGTVQGGVELHVPAPEVERARELLER